MKKTFIEDRRENNELDEPDRRRASMKSESMKSDFYFILDELDAYGHLSYVASAGSEWDEDWEERGDLLLCADYKVFSPVEYHPDYDDIEPVWVAYHVVANSESGSFIETREVEMVPASKAPFDLVINLTDCMADMCQTEDEYKSAEKSNEKWNRDLKASIESEQKRGFQ